MPPSLQPGGKPCFTQQCPTISCPFTGLTPGATYTVSMVGVLAGGERRPSSNTITITMPGAGAITLISATATGFTSGKAVAAPPPGQKIVKVMHVVLLAGRRYKQAVPFCCPDDACKRMSHF